MIGADPAAATALSVADVALRAMHPDDLAQVAALERLLFGAGAWSERAFVEELYGFGRTYFVAVVPPAVGPTTTATVAPLRAAQPTVIGYAGLWFNGDFAEVCTIAVAPRWQRRGVGELLMTALLERARGLGAESVLLEVRVDNGPAIRLYERFGFEPIGVRPRYYQPEDVDALSMRLLLPSEHASHCDAAWADQTTD